MNHGLIEIQPATQFNPSSGAVLTNGSDGTLQLDIANGTSFGSIDATGAQAFNVDGTLVPALLGGYAPPAGTVFPVITGAHTGTFAQVANN